jgi:hypothetical protein
MRRAIPLLPSTPLWRGAQLKNSTGTTLPLPLSMCLLLLLWTISINVDKLIEPNNLVNHSMVRHFGYFGKLRDTLKQNHENLCSRPCCYETNPCSV